MQKREGYAESTTCIYKLATLSFSFVHSIRHLYYASGGSSMNLKPMGAVAAAGSLSTTDSRPAAPDVRPLDEIHYSDKLQLQA
jgi:hypothetical protein